MLLFRINASITGSSVVNVVFQLFGVMLKATPKICKVLSKVDPPGWVVITVIGSKKSRFRAAIMPAL
jgi:hypothetical protein